MNAVWHGDPGDVHRRNPILYVSYKKNKENKNELVYGPLERYTQIKIPE